MTNTPEQIAAMRERLRDALARREAERGRPLTDQERLENLAAFLAEPDDDAEPPT